MTHTIDGGANWVHQSTSGNLVGIDFADTNSGLIATNVSQVARRTMNGGVEWTASIMPVPGFIALDVEMVDNLTGWIVGRTGGVVRTDDGGVTWSQQSFDDGSWWPGISMLSDTTGWAVSFYGKVRYTTNGGLLWSPQFTGTLNHLESVSAFEPIPEPTIGDMNGDFNVTVVDAALFVEALTNRPAYDAHLYDVNADTATSTVAARLTRATWERSVRC